MAAVASLAVSFVARTKNFNKGVKRMKRHVDSFATSLKRSATRVAKWGAAIAAVATGAMVLLVRNSLKTVDAIAKTSDKLGIATEELIGLQFAAELTGVELTALNKGLQMMIRNIGDAAEGTGEAVEEFKKLGINAKAMLRLTPEKQLGVIADAMQKLGTSTERVATMTAIFGARNVGLLNTMRGGSAGLREFTAEAKRLGLTISRQGAAKIEMANDAMTRLKASAIGTARAFSEQLSPLIVIASDHLINMRVDSKRLTAQFVSGLESMALALDKFVDLAKKAPASIKAAQEGIKEVVLLGGAEAVSGLDQFVTGMENVRKALLVFSAVSAKAAFGVFSGARDRGTESLAVRLGKNLGKNIVQGFKSSPLKRSFLSFLSEAMRDFGNEARDQFKAIFDSLASAGKSNAIKALFDAARLEVAKIGEEAKRVAEEAARRAAESAAAIPKPDKPKAQAKVQSARVIDLTRISIEGLQLMRERKQKVEDEQLQETNRHLRTIANNTAGGSVAIAQ